MTARAIDAHRQHKFLAALTHGWPHASRKLIKGELPRAVGVKVAEESLQVLLTQVHSTLHQPLLELHTEKKPTQTGRGSKPISNGKRSQPLGVSFYSTLARASTLCCYTRSSPLLEQHTQAVVERGLAGAARSAALRSPPQPS